MRRTWLTAAITALVLGVLVAPILGGCGENGEADVPAQEGQEASQLLSEQAQLLVDQGNLAQREERYSDALDLFGQALDMHPDHPVPQFGSLLAATALGDTALAQSLREKLAVTGPELLGMLGPGGGMGGSAPDVPGVGHIPQEGVLPQGHPTLPDEPRDTLRPETGRRG